MHMGKRNQDLSYLRNGR